MAHYEQALSAVHKLPSTPETHILAIDLRFDLRKVLYPLGRGAQGREHLLAAMPIAEALGDKRRLGWLLAHTARDTSLLGDTARALDLGQRALVIAESLGDLRLRTLTMAYLGVAHHARGEYRHAVRLLRESVVSLGFENRYETLGLPGPAAVFLRAWLVWALARLGVFTDGRQYALEALEVAESADHPLPVAVGHYSLGVLALFQNDIPRAIAALERSLDLCNRWDLRSWFTNIASHLGFAYARAGRLEQGIELLRQAIARISNPYDTAHEYAMFAEACLHAGRCDEARKHAERALALARTHEERGNEAWALWVFGEVVTQAALGQSPPVTDYHRQALALAAELDMQPLVAHCHASLARVFTAMGQEAAAFEALAAAEALFRQLEMPQMQAPHP